VTERQVRQLKAAFLEAFAQLGNVSAAAREAGCGRATVYGWQEHDPDFVLGFRQAEIASIDALETEARRRALGYEATALAKDGTPYTVTRYSDVLLIFLLKGARPEKYRDQVDVNVSQVVRAYRNLDAERV
jgi:hypothetical protein